MEKRYCKKHLNCPYCDKEQGDDKAKCVRTGCIFMYPCELNNERKKGH